MDNLQIKINGIRNIQTASLALPFENGIYTFVGHNGCGKSTLMECLSLLLPRKGQIKRLFGTSAGSSVEFNIDGQTTKWSFDNNSNGVSSTTPLTYMGLYEGSLFYGTRFEDSRIIDTKIAKGEITEDILADADQYVKERISYILHGTTEHYSSLVRIKNYLCAKKIGIHNRPHFIRPNGSTLISQYRMSSGECLLISLMHFLYNSIVRRSLSAEKKILVLIDELELALHPVAVVRLIEFLKDLVSEHDNLIIYLSSHSPEVIKMIPPIDLFKVENNKGILTLENNCYPSYLIRDLYSNISPDFLLLVEDKLAQQFINSIIHRNNLRSGKLIHVVPVGGWENVLTLHNELYSKKVLGCETKIISILDGDVKQNLTKAQKRFPHLFLPIQSIEKFLYSVIIKRSNPKLRRMINDKYFIIDSLDSIVSEYNKGTLSGANDNNKNFYSFLIKYLIKGGITEDVFIANITNDILSEVDTTSFITSLKDMIG